MARKNSFESFDLDMSSWTMSGAIIIFLKHLMNLLTSKKASRFVAVLDYTIICWYVYRLFSKFIPWGYLASVVSFIAATVLFLFILMKGANYYFGKYRIEYITCIRDFLFQMTIAAVCAAVFIFISDIAVLAVFVVMNLALVAVYDKILAKKKLPDMRIVQDLKADAHDDIKHFEYSAGCGLKKIEIAHETRDCFILAKGAVLKYDVRGQDFLRLSIGTKDFGRSGCRLNAEGFYPDGERIILFSKKLAPQVYFRDRTWNDTVIPLLKRKDGSCIERIEFSLDSKNGSSVYVSLSVSLEKKQKERKKNIYLLVVDSLRRDYFDSFSSSELKSFPNIASLLTDATIYSKAFTQGTWTLPALASIFSGLHVSLHDVHHPTAQRPMPDSYPVLAEILRRNEYETYGYVTGPRTSPNYGYARGFDKYYYAICDKETAVATAESAVDWVIRQHREPCGGRDRFFYLHLIDTHTPYFPPRNFEWLYNKVSYTDVNRDIKKYKKLKSGPVFDEEQMALYKDLYRAEINYTMAHLDHLLGYLKNIGAYDDSIIMITGDHGASFGEHNPFNVIDLFDEYLHVGLAVKYPGHMHKHGISDELVSANTDVAPTVLDTMGIACDAYFSGRSLAKSISRSAGIEDGVVISEDLYVRKYFVSIRDAVHTFIYRTEFDGNYYKNFNRCNEKFELYNIKDDPAEKENIFSVADKSVKDKFVEILNRHVNDSLNFHGVKQDIVINY